MFISLETKKRINFGIFELKVFTLLVHFKTER